MENGLYSVRFNTPLGQGSGVIYVKDGQLRGGDAIIAYIGIYTQQAGDEIHATIRTKRHQPGGNSVFGKDDVSITLVGHGTTTSAAFQGSSPQAPGLAFGATLNRISD